MCRINPILYRAPDAAHVIAIIGAVTALLGATIACAQNDIKKILAYSTISQLGYMFLAAGIGAYDAAIFSCSRTRSTRPPLLGSRLGDTRDERRSGREDDGGPRTADADHGGDVLHRMALDRRPTGVLGLLSKGDVLLNGYGFSPPCGWSAP